MIQKKMTIQQKRLLARTQQRREQDSCLKLIVTGTEDRFLQSEREFINNYINKEMSVRDALEAAGYRRNDYRVFHKKLVYDKIKALMKDLDDVLVAKKAATIKKLFLMIDKHIDDKVGNARFAMQAIQELNRMHGVYDEAANVTQVNINNNNINMRADAEKTLALIKKGLVC